ncbi:MAG TPA: hypothetical protein VF463_08555 [Sphingobium sp.]
MSAANRCSCGRTPQIRARARRDGLVLTQVTCPGTACGAQGREHLDDHRNAPEAVALWNQHDGRKLA